MSSVSFSPRVWMSVVAALVALGWLTPEPAQAKCAAPRMQLAVADGDTVPPDPVLWVFGTTFLSGTPSVEVTDDQGRQVEVTLEAVDSDSPELRAWRVRLDHDDDASALTVHTPDGPEETVTVRIDPGWKAPSGEPLSTLTTERETFHWPCSHQDTLNLSVDAPALAYEVEYAATLEAWEAGERQRVVLPADLRRFYGPPEADATRAFAVLELGHVSCMGQTLAWPGESMVVGITAHRADGSQTALHAESLHLTCEGCR